MMSKKHGRRVFSLAIFAVLAITMCGCTLLDQTRAVPNLSQTQGTIPLTVTYDASLSEGRDGISTYRWRFGEEDEFYGVSGSYTFSHAGQYEVELTVRAADGTTDTESVMVHVEPALWVCDENLDEIYQLDMSGTVLRTLDSPSPQPRGIALAERNSDWSLFVACMGDGFQRLFEIDPETGEVRAEFPAPGQSPGGLAYSPVSPGRLWHIDRLSRMIYEINPQDGRILNVFGATYFQASPLLIDAVFLQTPIGIAWTEGPYAPGSLAVLESETHELYELEVVAAVNIFSATQLEIKPDPMVLSSSLFPIHGYDWYDGFLWVVARDQHKIMQVDPSTGLATGAAIQGFPGAATSGLSIQK